MNGGKENFSSSPPLTNTLFECSAQVSILLDVDLDERAVLEELLGSGAVELGRPGAVGNRGIGRSTSVVAAIAHPVVGIRAANASNILEVVRVDLLAGEVAADGGEPGVLEVVLAETREREVIVLARVGSSSRELTLEEWSRRPWYNRLAESVIRLFAPLL